MISWLGAAFLVVGLLVLIRLFRLVERSGDVVKVARRSWDVIRNGALSDEAKEEALQEDAKRLLRLFFVLASGGAAAVLVPVGALWVCDQLGWISLESVFSVALSPPFLIGSAVFALLALFIPREKTDATSSYSAMDRFMHRVAFATFGAQAVLADAEDRLFARQLSATKVRRPVFITALPRAGTTLLLELLVKLPEFASHCYRDMPFVLIPCLWNRFSERFQQTIQLRERAHGDGMLIGLDSPEALEEVLWKTFWPRHYRKDRIVPWEAEDHEEFEEFFRSHMRKIMLLRRGPSAHEARYLSKNNLNIARVPALRRLFSDSVIVVLFRDPVQQAASLLQQHRNFLHIHQTDPFASTYMRAIGHYDFGKNLRPIDFNGWIETRAERDSESLAFWLEYWVVTYGHLLKERDQFVLLSYEALCAAPAVGLRRLGEAIASDNGDLLVAQASVLRTPQARKVDISSVAPSLLEEARRLFGSLREAAL